MNSIPVFFAANPSYYQHLCVMIVSLLENNKDRNFRVHVLTDDDSDTESEKIRELEKSYDNLEIHFRKIVEDDVKAFHLSKLAHHISIQAYYRCLIPKLYPDIGKAIYLDSDMVVQGDLGDLWDENIEEYLLAGVDISQFARVDEYKKRIGLTQESMYINSGVLLMNLRKMRENDIVALLVENAGVLGTKAELVDQDVINYSLQGNMKALDPRYNWTHVHNDELKKPALPIVISHFSGPGKPWSTNRICKHAGRKDYFVYLQKTPYRDFVYRYYLERSYKCVIPYIMEIGKSLARIVLPREYVARLREIRANRIRSR